MRLLTLILLAVLAFPLAARADDWKDPDLGESIRQGAADSRSIWLLGRSGAVVRFDRASGERAVVATGARVLLVDGPRVWLLTQPVEGQLALQDLRDPTTQVRFEAHAVPRVLFADRDVPAMLSPARLYQYEGEDGWESRTFAGVLDEFGFGQAALATSGDLYVGYNRGEWGGGLRRIRLDGSIAFVSAPDGDLCGGKISPACEPVLGLFRDPQQPDCVTVGTGLAHLGMTLGRVYRVCGDSIDQVWETPGGRFGGLSDDGGWALSSLAPTRDGWVGVGDGGGRYAVSRSGVVTEAPMPALRDWSGLRISPETDGLLFVMSACCWGVITNPTRYAVIALPVIED